MLLGAVKGNHELENKNVKNNPAPFASWIARMRTPYKQSNSTTPLYYSWNLAGEAHPCGETQP